MGRARQLLVEALCRIAASPDQLNDVFPRYVSVADELALSLDDAILVCRAQENLAELGAAPSVAVLDDHFRSFSGEENAQAWTMEAVRSDERWILARELARRALAELGEVLVPATRSYWIDRPL